MLTNKILEIVLKTNNPDTTYPKLYKLSLVENQFKTGDYTTTFSTLVDLVYFLDSQLLHNLLKNSNMFDRVVIEYNGEIIVNADKIIDKLI